ncbi:MAG: isoleucine--tRNA ligase, partial [Muribaculaceae bacterium]|nr:isoleucine--tRNA ligase [Muribaculaceae bacterium]
VLALRRKVGIKVRQPLGKLMIPVVDKTQEEDIRAMQDLILSEVNVKDIKFVSSEDGVLVKRVKPDFKKLGPKFGKTMRSVAKAITEMSQADINAFERNGVITIEVEGNPATIEVADVEIFSEDIPGWLVANEGNVTIALDINVTENLKNEGLARELVNRIQNIRKSRGYDITDRITVTISPEESIERALKEYGNYIANQVLADKVELMDVDKVADDEMLDIDGLIVKCNVCKK